MDDHDPHDESSGEDDSGVEDDDMEVEEVEEEPIDILAAAATDRTQRVSVRQPAARAGTGAVGSGLGGLVGIGGGAPRSRFGRALPTRNSLAGRPSSLASTEAVAGAYEGAYEGGEGYLEAAVDLDARHRSEVDQEQDDEATSDEDGTDDESEAEAETKPTYVDQYYTSEDRGLERAGASGYPPVPARAPGVDPQLLPDFETLPEPLPQEPPLPEDSRPVDGDVRVNPVDGAEDDDEDDDDDDDAGSFHPGGNNSAIRRLHRLPAYAVPRGGSGGHFKAEKISQRTLHRDKYTPDGGCRRCEMGPKFKKGHAPTCPRSREYRREGEDDDDSEEIYSDEEGAPMAGGEATNIDGEDGYDSDASVEGTTRTVYVYRHPETLSFGLAIAERDYPGGRTAVAIQQLLLPPNNPLHALAPPGSAILSLNGVDVSGWELEEVEDRISATEEEEEVLVMDIRVSPVTAEAATAEMAGMGDMVPELPAAFLRTVSREDAGRRRAETDALAASYVIRDDDTNTVILDQFDQTQVDLSDYDVAASDPDWFKSYCKLVALRNRLALTPLSTGYGKWISPPPKSVDADGTNKATHPELRGWVDEQRSAYAKRRATLKDKSADSDEVKSFLAKMALLDSIQFVWTSRAELIRSLKGLTGTGTDDEEEWREYYLRYAEHVYSRGHGCVPNCTELGMWCGMQRSRRRGGALRWDRALRLSSLGFDWSEKADEMADWSEMRARFEAYRTRHGDGLVMPSPDVDDPTGVRDGRQLLCGDAWNPNPKGKGKKKGGKGNGAKAKGNMSSPAAGATKKSASDSSGKDHEDQEDKSNSATTKGATDDAIKLQDDQEVNDSPADGDDGKESGGDVGDEEKDKCSSAAGDGDDDKESATSPTSKVQDEDKDESESATGAAGGDNKDANGNQEDKSRATTGAADGGKMDAASTPAVEATVSPAEAAAVPEAVSDDDAALWWWTQHARMERQRLRRGSDSHLTPARIARLDAAGFVWNAPQSARWIADYRALVRQRQHAAATAMARDPEQMKRLEEFMEEVRVQYRTMKRREARDRMKQERKMRGVAKPRKSKATKDAEIATKAGEDEDPKAENQDGTKVTEDEDPRVKTDEGAEAGADEVKNDEGTKVSGDEKAKKGAKARIPKMPVRDWRGFGAKGGTLTPYAICLLDAISFPWEADDSAAQPQPAAPVVQPNVAFYQTNPYMWGPRPGFVPVYPPMMPFQPPGAVTVAETSPTGRKKRRRKKKMRPFQRPVCCPAFGDYVRRSLVKPIAGAPPHDRGCAERESGRQRRKRRYDDKHEGDGSSKKRRKKSSTAGEVEAEEPKRRGKRRKKTLVPEGVVPAGMMSAAMPQYQWPAAAMQNAQLLSAAAGTYPAAGAGYQMYSPPAAVVHRLPPLPANWKAEEVFCCAKYGEHLRKKLYDGRGGVRRPRHATDCKFSSSRKGKASDGNAADGDGGNDGKTSSKVGAADVAEVSPGDQRQDEVATAEEKDTSSTEAKEVKESESATEDNDPDAKGAKGSESATKDTDPDQKSLDDSVTAQENDVASPDAKGAEVSESATEDKDPNEKSQDESAAAEDKDDQEGATKRRTQTRRSKRSRK